MVLVQYRSRAAGLDAPIPHDRVIGPPHLARRCRRRYAADTGAEPGDEQGLDWICRVRVM